MAGIRGNSGAGPAAWNDPEAWRYGDQTKAQIAQLMQQYAGGIGQGTLLIDRGESDGNADRFTDFNIGGQHVRMQNRYNNPEDPQSGPKYNLNDPAQAMQALAGYRGALSPLHVNADTGTSGSYIGNFDAGGNLLGIGWEDEQKSGWLKQNIGTWGPMAVLAFAAGMNGMLPGQTSAAPPPAATQGFTPGFTQGPAMSAMPGTGSALQLPAGIGGGNAAMTSVMPGTLQANAIQAGLLPGFSGELASAALAAQGAITPTQAAQAPQTAAAAPAAGPSTEQAAAGGFLSKLADGAQIAAPLMSLLGGVSGVQGGVDAQAPRVPGASLVAAPEAPPEQRGYQAGVAPILDVLGRNRQGNRNRTLLTGSRGVNMESTLARGNSLLGL